MFVSRLWDIVAKNILEKYSKTLSFKGGKNLIYIFSCSRYQLVVVFGHLFGLKGIFSRLAIEKKKTFKVLYQISDHGNTLFEIKLSTIAVEIDAFSKKIKIHPCDIIYMIYWKVLRQLGLKNEWEYIDVF